MTMSLVCCPPSSSVFNWPKCNIERNPCLEFSSISGKCKNP
uniref:Uncharacterized protein n=1 Tax=Anguilla anguilla TaxID=7936 RepID=A0A0E9Q2E2_ANGAN